MSRLGILLLSATALAGCQAEAHRTAPKPVPPPVASPEAIPDAPVNGTLRGQKFTLKDARYVTDHRMGYKRVDIKLSAGAAESACGGIKPVESAMVWLRLERSDKIDAQDLRLEPGKASPWSVHYQVREGERWVGNADGSAVVQLRPPGPDGKVSGSIAVCFADDQKSCVSGSFDALDCPPAIDAPVRGTIPPEKIPDKYKSKVTLAVPAPAGSVAAPAPAPTGAEPHH